jgi:hypothetical protein
MNTAEKIYEAVKNLPERQAGEILSLAEAMRAKRDEDYAQAERQALALLDDPPLSLNGRYWSRDSLHDRL